MNVPKLRFKEFTNEWAKEKLGQTMDIQMCKRIFANQTSTDEEIPFFKIGTIGSIPDTFISRTLFEEYKMKYNYPKKGEILITCSGTVGKCLEFNGEDSYFQDSNIVWINNPEEKILNEFLYYLLSRVNWSNLNSTTITRIYNDNLRNLELIFPCKSEQNKIYKTLKLIDKKIELQSQKIEALKLYKKGLLLNYFKGKKTNKIIKDIIKYGKAGGTPKSSVKEYYNGKIPFLSISDMTKQGKYIYNTERNISEIGLKNSSAWLVPEDSIILSMYASYGLVAINKIKLSTSQAMFNMILNDNVFVEYIYQYLNYLNISNYYDKLISTGTQSNLNAEKIYNIKIFIPEFNEQKLIANLLNCIDILIEFNIKKKKNYHKLKKGLMQNMFV